jgi:hypothetical protein
MTGAILSTISAGHRLIFVGGSSRSGTTRAQNILDSHLGNFSRPEFLHLWRIIDLRNCLHRSVTRGYILHTDSLNKWQIQLAPSQ